MTLSAVHINSCTMEDRARASSHLKCSKHHLSQRRRVEEKRRCLCHLISSKSTTKHWIWKHNQRTNYRKSAHKPKNPSIGRTFRSWIKTLMTALSHKFCKLGTRVREKSSQNKVVRDHWFSNLRHRPWKSQIVSIWPCANNKRVTWYVSRRKKIAKIIRT